MRLPPPTPDGTSTFGRSEGPRIRAPPKWVRLPRATASTPPLRHSTKTLPLAVEAVTIFRRRPHADHQSPDRGRLSRLHLRREPLCNIATASAVISKCGHEVSESPAIVVFNNRPLRVSQLPSEASNPDAKLHIFASGSAQPFAESSSFDNGRSTKARIGSNKVKARGRRFQDSVMRVVPRKHITAKWSHAATDATQGLAGIECRNEFLCPHAIGNAVVVREGDCLASGATPSRIPCCRRTLVHVMPKGKRLESMTLPRPLRQGGSCSVRRGVVHDDHLKRRNRLRIETSQKACKFRSTVVRRDDH